MKILALESASEACSAALSVDGKIVSRYEVAPQKHAQLLLPMIDEVMKEAGLKPAELDGLAYGHGPGSFTGVRIAAGMIQGIALGCDIPAVGVSTLQAIAHRNWRESGQNNTLSVIDARMKEVYFGAYSTNDHGQSVLLGEECVDAPENVSVESNGPWSGAGSGWAVYESTLNASLGEPVLGVASDLLPHAIDIVELALQRFALGEAVPAQLAMPVYLRDKVAFTEKERIEIKRLKSSKQPLNKSR